MKLVTVALPIVAVLLNTACKTRDFNSASDLKDNLESLQSTLPFNALQMLENPKIEPITSFPKNYGKLGFNIVKPDGNGMISVASDQVFFSAIKDWFGSIPNDQSDTFARPKNSEGAIKPKVLDYQLTATPTSYASVKSDSEDDGESGGVLSYKLDGRTLDIKVSEVQETEMNHTDAIEACARKQMRLPTARELFDFCFAGRTPLAKPNLMNPLNSRCATRYNWTVTLKADNRQDAWSVANWITNNDRRNVFPFRCVSKK